MSQDQDIGRQRNHASEGEGTRRTQIDSREENDQRHRLDVRQRLEEDAACECENSQQRQHDPPATFIQTTLGLEQCEDDDGENRGVEQKALGRSQSDVVEVVHTGTPFLWRSGHSSALLSGRTHQVPMRQRITSPSERITSPIPSHDISPLWCNSQYAPLKSPVTSASLSPPIV